MRQLTLAKKCELLEGMAKTLVNQCKTHLPMVMAELESTEPLPDNCPDRATLAFMELGYVEQAVREVNGMLQQIQEHIRDSGA